MNGHLLFRHSLIKVCISQPARPLREKGHSLAPMLCTQEQNCFDNCIFRFSAKQIKTIFILEYVFTKNKVDNLEGSRRKSGLDRLKDGLCPQSSAFLGFKD
jgi:hypothetical protein